jgi:hypothetical protein
MTPTASTEDVRMSTAIRRPHRHATAIRWGLVVGVVNAAAPLVFWWLEPATVHALIITLIAAVYVGFAVADGRPRVIAVEAAVTSAFVVLAAAAVTTSAWLLVAAYAAHGLKDFWQERRHFVAGTRWWPPFCATIDWLVASVLTVEILAGVSFS